MARVSSTIILTMMLTASLAISGCGETSACKKASEFCGGKGGFECCEGLQCILEEGNFVDAGGECKPTSTTPSCKNSGQFCGGIAGFPDAGGACRKVKRRSCHKVGQFCGGFTGAECCKGLYCVVDDVDFPDAGGKCKRAHY